MKCEVCKNELYYMKKKDEWVCPHCLSKEYYEHVDRMFFLGN